jgi:regulatory protein
VQNRRHSKPRPPIDAQTLEALAYHYVGRYATTRHKLSDYLRRKLRERGWEGEGTAPVETIVERFTELKLVDDQAFASMKAASLMRRGYGERRLGQALQAAGVEEEDGEPAREEARDGALAAALRFAERRRIGPYAPAPLEREAQQKAIAAMVRAGHPFDVVRKVVYASPGDIPDSDSP